MARTTTTSKVSYTANGSTTAFAYNFPMVLSTNAVVTVTDASGVETTKTNPTHYSITVNSNGGTVTFVTAPTSGHKVTIRRVVPLTQGSDWSNGSAVSQSTFEDAVDKLTDLNVQIQEQLDRIPKFKLSSSFSNIEFPELTAGKAIRVNDAGTGLVCSTLTFDTMLADVTTQSNLAIAARTQADIDAAATAADRIIVAADKAIVIADMATVAADKATVASDKATVAADKAIVIADMATVAADKAIVIADMATVAADKATVASDLAASGTYRTDALNYKNQSETARDLASTYKDAALTYSNSASLSATNAATSETNAAASAVIAANAAAGTMYNSVIDVSSNTTLATNQIGQLVRVDTTSGAITITLPSVSSGGEGWRIAIAKKTSDANAVNIVRAGSDTINGGTTYQLTSQWSAATIVADSATTSWFAIGTGAGAGNVTVDTFTGNGSQTAFTLTAGPGSTNSTNVFLDGNYQNKSTYSVSGTTLTFTTAPPNGVAIEVEYGGVLSVGTPADNTVSTVKLVDSAVTTAKIADANVTAAKLSMGVGTSANNLVQLNGSGQLPAVDGSLLTGLSMSMFKNILIGGNFYTNPWQRGTSVTLSVANNVAVSQAAGTAFGTLTSGGGLAAAFDGNNAQTQSASANNASGPTCYVGKDWGAGVTKTLSKAVIYPGNDNGFTSAASNNIDVRIYGSSTAPTTGIDGTLLGSTGVMSDQTTPVTLASLTATTAYRYHWCCIFDNETGLQAVAELNFFENQQPTAYAADMWKAWGANTGSALTVSQQASGITGYPKCLRLQRTASNTDTGVLGIAQVVETINATPYQGQNITLSFQARSGTNFSAASSALAVNVATGTGTDQSSASFIAGTWTGQSNNSSNVTLTTSFQTFTKTIAVPSNATEIAVSLSYTPVGTAGANDYFEVANVQLEQGSTATTFENLPVDTVLGKCQRYLEVMGGDQTNTRVGAGAANTTNNINVLIQFSTQKRSVPILTYLATSDWYATAGTGQALATVIGDCAQNSRKAMTVYATTSGTPFTVGHASCLIAANTNARLIFSSEL